MSNLLQLQRNRLLIFLIFLFFIKEVCAGSLGVSPPSLEFDFTMSGQKCYSVEVYADNFPVVIEDYWSLQGSRDVKDYNLSSEEVGIIINYQNEIFVKEKKKTDICINVVNEGNYYGLLMFSSYRPNVGIGIWIKADYNGKGREIKDAMGNILGTGNIVKEIVEESEENSGFSVFIGGSLFLSFLLILVLGMLLLKLRRIRLDKVV